MKSSEFFSRYILGAIVLLGIATSCNKMEDVDNEINSNKVVITASLPACSPKTKLSYEDAAAENVLKVDWRVAGESIAVVGNNEKSLFSQVEDGPRDSFEGTMPQANEYVAYYPASVVGENCSVTYDYSQQMGVLCDDLTYMRGELSGENKFDFEYLSALLKLEFKINGVNANTSIYRVLVKCSGEYEQWQDITMICPLKESIYLYIPGDLLQNGDKLLFTVYTDNEIYSGEITANKTIEAGVLYPATVNLQEKDGVSVAVTSGTQAEAPYYGDGKKDSPYIIEDASELLWMVTNLTEKTPGAYYKLARDFTIALDNWPCDLANPFTGILDGNGHTINGKLISPDYAPIFGFFAQNAGVIKNLNIAANVKGSGEMMKFIIEPAVPEESKEEKSEMVGGVGAIAGLNFGSIENCTSSGEIFSDPVSSPGIYAVGGIAGGMLGGDILNCQNSGAVRGTSSSIPDSYVLAGGIAGLVLSDMSDVTIENCINTGSIICGGKIEFVSETETAGSYVGGIVARCLRSKKDASINLCKNYGIIEGATVITIEGGAGDLYVGGIVGEGQLVQITESANYEAATVKGGTCSGNTYTGGIAGALSCPLNGEEAIGVRNTIFTQNCYNYAEIIGGTARYVYTGGIVGKNELYMEGCVNYGKVEGGKSKTNEKLFVGGIAGCNFDCIAQIKNSVNWGTIISGFLTQYNEEYEIKEEVGNYVGGIAGLNHGSTYNGTEYKASIVGCTSKVVPVVHGSNVGTIHNGVIVGENKGGIVEEN